MAVLYRKYRPKVFSEVVGQGTIVQTLSNALRQGKVAHAYLFTGTRGVGKTTVARVLARVLNCTQVKDGEACLSCSVCKAFNDGTFLDMVEIDAASHTGVDNIRELIEHVRFQPTLGKFKVFIIDETHMLSKAAFNALLKTLEEPPSHVVFILATTELSKLPITIVSRTQRFDFKRVDELVISKHLEFVSDSEGMVIPKDVLGLIARHADGSIRDALSVLGKFSSLPEISLAAAREMLGATGVEYSRNLFQYILEGNVAKVADFFNLILEDGLDVVAFNKDFLEYLRLVLLTQVGGGKASIETAFESLEFLEGLAGGLSLGDTMHIIRIFLKSFKDLQGSEDELPILLAGLEAALKFQKSMLSGTIQQSSPVIIPAMPVVLQEVSTKPVLEEFMTTGSSPVLEVGGGAPGNLSSVTREELLVSWPAVGDYLKTINGPLATLVRNAPIKRVDKGVVVLGVKFIFHKEHIESAKNQANIGDAIFNVSGQRLGVAAELLEKEISTKENQAGLVGDVLSIFGGELVE